MVFSSVEFLFFYLPVVMAVYFVLPRSVRNFWLMLASVVFYSWGGWAFLPILFVSVIADYALGFL
ncbi:MAG: MBOAT family protein, partial [Acidimicrobiia bacterium]|nr:MBOAT family protein [Acidimicrobiia bacterium]